MQSAMLRLDGLLRRRRRLVLIAWAAVLIAAVPFAARQSEDLSSGGFDVPGSQSAEVAGALDRFPGVARAQLAAVLVPAPGAGAGAARGRRRPRRRRGRAGRRRLDRRRRRATGPPRRRAPAARSSSRCAPRSTRTAPPRWPSTCATGWGSATARRDGVTTHLVGQGALWAGMQELSKEDLAKAESAGFPVVLLILLFVFGSLAAAALPLALGFVSVLVTGALIFALSQVMEMSVFVTNMASMIGIGVAVDYSLFIVARYREEVAAGREPGDARAVAMATSGLAVLFSGLTVIISLAGLWMIDNTAIRSMALGAMLVVGVAILAATTLLPVLIRLLGRRAYTRGRLFSVTGLLRRRRPARPAGAPGFWQRWTDGVMRRPVLAVAGTTAMLLALAAPVLGMTTGTGALDQFPRDHETRQGFEAAAARTGPGASAPIQVVVRGDDAGGPAAPPPDGSARRWRDDPGVARVAEPVAARDGGAVLVGAEPRADGESPAAHATVDRLRASLPAVAGAGRRGRRRRRHRVAGRHARPRERLDVEDPAVPARALLPRAARAAALGRAAAQGGAGQPAQRGRGVRRAQPRLRPGRHAHAAARAGGRLRPLDGLRGVPAVAHPRALRGDRRHAHRRGAGPRRERADDHVGGA